MRLAAAAVAPGNHTGVCACVTDPGSPYTNLATKTPIQKMRIKDEKKSQTPKGEAGLRGYRCLQSRKKIVWVANFSRRHIVAMHKKRMLTKKIEVWVVWVYVYTIDPNLSRWGVA